MKSSLRIISLALVLCIIVSAFTGCSPSNPDSPIASTPSAAPSFNDDTLIVTIEGSPVYWSEFVYWLNFSLQYCGFTPGSKIDWDMEYASGMTLAEYVMYDAVKAVALYRMIDHNAELMGVTLSDDDKANIETIMTQNREYFESDEDYEAYLASSYLTEELMEYLLSCSCRYYNIFAKMFGAGGETISDTEAIAFGIENNYYRAKHILMAFSDDEGVPYSAEEMDAKYALLEDLLAQINAASDPVAAFDQFMTEYSEDPGSEAYPDGYQFVKGDMVDEFQTAIDELDEYGVSDIVTMGDYGYTIIMRLPLDPDAAALSDISGYTLRYLTANYAFEALANTWALEANIEYSDNYNYINLSELF